MTGVTTRGRDGSVRFVVRVQPRASCTEIAGVRGGILRVRVHAPPVDGAANASVIAVIAGALGVSRAAVQIVGGHSSRNKTLEVAGVSEAAVRRIFEGG